MGGEIVLEIGLRVTQRHAVVLEERMDLESCFQPEQPSDLTFRESAPAISLDRQRFERLLRQIRPVSGEDGRDVIGQIECDLHGEDILAPRLDSLRVAFDAIYRALCRWLFGRVVEELGRLKPELAAPEVRRRASRRFCRLPHYIGYP